MNSFHQLIHALHKKASLWGAQSGTIVAGAGQAPPLWESLRKQIVECLFFHFMQPFCHRPSRAKPQQHGLSRAEWLWMVGLGLGITLLILGTLRHDLSQAKVRRASDVLDYLTAQVHHAMQTADESQWPATLVGPGEVPRELPLETSGLADLLAPTVFLPTDPWGHAYVISRQDTMKRPTWLVRSAGPRNQLPTAQDLGQALIRELIPPQP